jgi:DNA-binding response OmpR family regulator
MEYRVLCVGLDADFLKTRQALLSASGYDSATARPPDVDEKLLSGSFDLVILSVMLSEEEKHHIQSQIPAGTRVLVLRTLVWPKELLTLVADALS